MDMCYEGALVLPDNYAVMNEEEMMYVEGGRKKIKVSTWILSSAIDIAVTCAFGGAATSAMGWLIGKGMSKVMNALVRGTGKWCVLLKNALGNGMGNLITSKLGLVGTAISFTSVGGTIMNLWDMFDNNRVNGYVMI